MAIAIIKAIILGVVEGITEFLPISSTGHLILINQWIGFSDPFTKMFDIVIQLGAILAVVVYFFNRLWPFSSDPEKNKAIWSLWSKAIVGVVPALILGALFGSVIEEKLFTPAVVAAALIIGGIILVIIEKTSRESRITSVADLSYRTVLIIGLIQTLAMVPGTSRSAATIIGAMLLGASRVVAAEFSFFLAIPTMVAASGYSLLKYSGAMSGAEMIALAAGFIVAFLVALAVIRLFMDYIRRHDFRAFGYYRIALGLIIVLYFLLK